MEAEKLQELCEDDGRCRDREGPDGWCDPCVAAHLPAWWLADEEVACILFEGGRCTHMACQATEDRNRHEAQRR